MGINSTIAANIKFSMIWKNIDNRNKDAISFLWKTNYVSHTNVFSGNNVGSSFITFFCVLHIRLGAFICWLPVDLMISPRLFNNKAAISHKAEFQHQTERFMIFVCCEFPIVMILAPQAKIRTIGWYSFKNILKWHDFF